MSIMGFGVFPLSVATKFGRVRHIRSASDRLKLVVRLIGSNSP